MFEFLSDPNVLQLMANAGSGMSPKGSFGQAVGDATSGMITNQQMQKALLGLLGGGTGQPVKATPNEVLDPNGMSTGTPWGAVTPKGQAGPDSHSVVTTADGVTHTVKIPSAANLNSYGTNVPPEAQPAPTQAQVPQVPTYAASGNNLPFWQTLFSN